MRIVPLELRSQARIVKLNRFSKEQVASRIAELDEQCFLASVDGRLRRPRSGWGPARRLPRVDVKCSIYGCYSMTDGLETPRKLCRFAELRPTLMSGDSEQVASRIAELDDD